MKHVYNFYIHRIGLNLQVRYDGWHTTFVWYKKIDGKPVVYEKSIRKENYDDFISRVAKLKIYKF